MEQQQFQKVRGIRNQLFGKRKMIQIIRKQNDKKQSLNGIRRKKKPIGYSCGQWNLRQTKLYFRYLSTHKCQFTDPLLRKKNKVFIKLADFIGSRTPDQCRSHHQKATRKYPIFNDLLSHYQQQIIEETKNYQQSRISYEEKILGVALQKPEQIENQCKQQNIVEDNEKQIKQRLKFEEIQNYQKQKLMEEVFVPKKVEKATQLVVSTNYYSLGYQEQNKHIRIEIDIKRMKEYELNSLQN